jgi:hypothetical protein
MAGQARPAWRHEVLRVPYSGTALGPLLRHRTRSKGEHATAPRIPPLQGAGVGRGLRMPLQGHYSQNKGSTNSSLKWPQGKSPQ